MSLAEAVTNVIIGYIMAVATQMIVFPVVGIRVPFGTNLMVGAIFTVVSIGRSYALRRMFEALRMRTLKRRAAAPAGGGRASVSPS